MASNDTAVGLGLGGLVLGAMLAAPSAEERALLENAKIARQIMLARQHRLGPVQTIQQLQSDPVAYNAFWEAYNLYIYGFFRPAATTASAVTEHLLRKKYGNEKFVTLIDTASKEGVLTPSDVHSLQVIRLDRNEYTHHLGQPVTEDQALVAIHLAIRVASKLL